MLRWIRQDARVADLARDARIAGSTAYRYHDEGITVLAEHASHLHTELTAAQNRGGDAMPLDGTLINTDRAHDRTPAPLDQPGDQQRPRLDRWYSREHHRHGGNMPVVSDAAGRPVLVLAGPGCPSLDGAVDLDGVLVVAFRDSATWRGAMARPAATSDLNTARSAARHLLAYQAQRTQHQLPTQRRRSPAPTARGS